MKRFEFLDGNEKHRFYSLMLNGKVCKIYPWARYSKSAAEDYAWDEVSRYIKKYGTDRVEYDRFYINN